MTAKEPLARTVPDEHRYRLLVDSITDYAIYMLNPQGIISSWNAGAQRFKGYTETEILGEHFSRFYTPEDRSSGLPSRALETAAREGRFENEGWRVKKDGSRFWAHVIIDPIRSPSGELLGYAKVTRDLTERKAALEALQSSENRFRLLVQSVTDYAIYMLDPQGRITNWNSGAQRIKGYLPSEIVGEHFSKFYTEEDRQRGEPQRGLNNATRTGRHEAEGLRVRKDGTTFWASVVIDAIRSDTGELLGFAKVTRDITERREAQLALVKAREALFQSQKMEAVGQLTGGIAHDFNNLLMAVVGSLELLRRRLADDPQGLQLVDNALRGAQRGAALTQRMLAFARRQDLELKPIDVPALVKSMSDLLQRALGPTVSIETHFPLSLPPVLTDANQLETALLNLAVNARDAMPNGGPIIIKARATQIAGKRDFLPEGHYVCLTVVDQGEGMDEETLARAAEPFFTTKGVGKGTGLGLPMVHGLAEQSGGRLRLISKKGEGTSAELWLPVATAAEAEAGIAKAVQNVAAPAVPGDRQPGSPLTILAVDDDFLVLMNTVALLEDLGHTVLQASSGSEALDLLKRQSVDLVISDQAMPKMTGVELGQIIRKSTPQVPILIATGYAELPAEMANLFSKLSKPFTQAQLAQAVEAAARRGQA